MGAGAHGDAEFLYYEAGWCQAHVLLPDMLLLLPVRGGVLSCTACVSRTTLLIVQDLHLDFSRTVVLASVAVGSTVMQRCWSQSCASFGFGMVLSGNTLLLLHPGAWH